MTRFREPEHPREELVLFTKRLDDAIPLDHPVRVFDDILDADAFVPVIEEMKKKYDGLTGRMPFCPSYLVRLYIYGMLNRLRSTRRLEDACRNRIDVMWLMCGQIPDHTTIAKFVKRHKKELRALLGKTVWVGVEANLLSYKMLGVDGTRIHANASVGSVRKKPRLADKLEAISQTIEELEEEWRANERKEQGVLGTASAPWTPPTSLERPKRLAMMEERKKKLQKALDEIARREAEATRAVQPVNSMTDPESRVMRGKKGGKAEPHYNAQVARDEGVGLITASEISDAPSDSGKAVPLADQSEANCGRQHDALSADALYNTGPDLRALEERGIVTYMPDSDGRATKLSDTAQEALLAMKGGIDLTEEQQKALPCKKNSGFPKEWFTFDAARDEYVCPAGERLRRVGRNKKEQGYGTVNRDVYGGCSGCGTCKYASICQDKVRAKGRRIYRDEYESYRVRVRGRMATDEGKAAYNQRSHLAETPFAFILENLGLRQFLHRGRELVAVEWDLACTAMNIKTLMKYMSEVAPILKANQG